MKSTGETYDRYWEVRDRDRTRARSATRATIALRLLRSQGLLRSDSEGPSLLEIGCGPGYALEVFVEAGLKARGLDVSERAAEDARSRGLQVDVGDLEGESDWRADPLDGIAALEVLEHLVEPLPVLEKMRDLVSPSGWLLVSLPNEFHVLRRLGMLCGRAPLGGHDDPHLRIFDDRLARRFFDAAGLRVIARASDGLVPPRLGVLRGLEAPFLRLFPGLFALSNVYLLRARGADSKSVT